MKSNAIKKEVFAVATLDGASVSLSIAPKKQNSHVMATVLFDDDDNMVIEGGKKGKKALENAKRYTSVCYVRDSERHASIKLILVDDQWVRLGKGDV